MKIREKKHRPDIFWTFIDGARESSENANLIINKAKTAKAIVYCGAVIVVSFQ
jgi:hypothetical protein